MNIIGRENKMVIYQVFPRWLGNLRPSSVVNSSLTEDGVGKFSAFIPLALPKIKELGVTHIWYTGVIEHATKTNYIMFGIQKDRSAIVKGKAGSPYAIKDCYNVDSDLTDNIRNRMNGFEDLVRRTHEIEMKVTIDFAPNHVTHQYFSDVREPSVEDLGQTDNVSKVFNVNNNFYYLSGQTLTLRFDLQRREDLTYSGFPAKVTDNNHFDAHPSQNDWYETVKLNYGVDYMHGDTCHFNTIPNMRGKMLEILLFQVDRRVDGFRCDMVEMVLVEFWNWVIPRVKKVRGVIFIAEVHSLDEYRNYIYTGHFDYLHDKAGLYDTVHAVMCGQAPVSNISHCWRSLKGIQKNMLNFLEDHDEQCAASDFFAGDTRSGIPGIIVFAVANTNSITVYSGQELGGRGMDAEGFSGRDGRVIIFDYWSVESLRNWNNNGLFDGARSTPAERSLCEMYVKLLNVVRSEPVIAEGAFYDLMYANSGNSYLNPNRQYAFLRKQKNEVLLMVVNFDRVGQHVWVDIPVETFKALDSEGNELAELADLLTGGTTISTLIDVCPYQARLPAYSGKMLKSSFLHK